MRLSNAWSRRRIAHHLHASAFFLLLVTGLLLFSPALRASFIGGYSLTLRRAHWWTGLAFPFLPLPILIGVRPNRTTPTHASGARTCGWLLRWRSAHTFLTVGTAALFAVTGVVMWFHISFPAALVDRSYDLHAWLTYGSCAVLAAHLYVAVLSSRSRRALNHALSAREESFRDEDLRVKEAVRE